MNTLAPRNLVPFIPDNAPFSLEQRAWLNGFLAGLFSGAEVDAAVAAPQPTLPLTILYGSETGNTASLAKKTAKSAKEAGFAVNLSCMSQYNFDQLKDEKNLLVLTSTYGEGEPPATAADFYNYLHSETAPRIPGLKYSVLALGDSNYPDFCKCGKDFDSRLEQLNAVRLSPRKDCDVDYEESYAEWFQGVLEALGSAAGLEAAESETESGYDKKNPFPAMLVDNRNLNGSESSKETHHVAISLEGSGLSYKPGDALGVYPRNCPDKVTGLIQALGFDPDHAIGSKPLSVVLETDYEIGRLTPAHIHSMADRSRDPELKILAGSDKEALLEYCWGREIIDLLEDFQLGFERPEDFLSILRKMTPRLYSISSSPAAHPGEVHLTVGVVRYKTHGRLRGGVCSTFLADRCGEGPVSVFLHHNDNFRLPADASVPVIMVGPGTGIAPFRAFLEERAATGAAGRNWLFFGDQHATCDFLYQEQLKELQAGGVLTRLDTAFSRDQEEKIYVQDRMRQQGAELFQWLQEGAHLYVCGDASRMARDVDKALLEIVAGHGGMSPEDAESYVRALKADRRYCRDVY